MLGSVHQRADLEYFYLEWVCADIEPHLLSLPTPCACCAGAIARIRSEKTCCKDEGGWAGVRETRAMRMEMRDDNKVRNKDIGKRGIRGRTPARNSPGKAEKSLHWFSKMNDWRCLVLRPNDTGAVETTE